MTQGQSLHLALMTRSWRAIWHCPLGTWLLAGLGALCWQLGEQAAGRLAVHLLGLAYGQGLLAPLFAAAHEMHEAAGAGVWLVLRQSRILEASTYPVHSQLTSLVGDVALLVAISWIAVLVLMRLMSRLTHHSLPWKPTVQVASWYVAAVLAGLACFLVPGLLVVIMGLPAAGLVCCGVSSATLAWREGLALGWRRFGMLSVLVTWPLGLSVVLTLLIRAMALAWPLGIGGEVILWLGKTVALLWLAQGLVWLIASCQSACSSARKERNALEVASVSSRKPM